MTSKGWLWFLPLLAATLALGGCGGSSSGALVNVASNSRLNTKILVDPKGMTLYLWDTESGGSPPVSTIRRTTALARGFP
jgi:predicted lipoprotein with Yx(FWY)xxD motif